MTPLPLERLTPLAASQLTTQGVARSPERTRSAEALTSLLLELSFPATPVVAAFERTWGGWTVPGSDGSGPLLAVGVWYSLDQGLSERGGPNADDLVPIAFTLQDDFVYFIHVQTGVVWGQHLVTMERAVPLNDDADTFLSSQVLWDLLVRRVVRKVEGSHQGEELAAHLDLPPLQGMQGNLERWWGDRRTLLNEAVVYGDGDLGQPATHLGTADADVVEAVDAYWAGTPMP